MSKIFFVLLVFFAIQVDNQPQNNSKTTVPSSSTSSDCKKITCFGSANCTILAASNTTKCVTIAQKTASAEDVIRKNLNFTDDYFNENSTFTNSTRNWNTTSLANHAMMFPVILSLTVTRL